MKFENHSYIAIDLKSFYASVECMERGLDPMLTNLVVADISRTEKTICLAVSPALKSFGIPGRPRLFEVSQKIDNVNRWRKSQGPNHEFSGKSFHVPDLENDSSLAVDYIIAAPQMAKYMQVSTEVYNIYLKYIAPEDIHVYSIDEVFIDATRYLHTYRTTPHGLAAKIIKDVFQTTGITATAGIGTNLFLAKVAMDIVAKHIPADRDGARIAELDEMSFRFQLWDHRPLTDFWRVGRGYAKKLERHGLFTMGDIAKCSVHNEDLLYQMFGKNAELLIDHAWGWEPCTIEDIKKYRPANTSVGSGQVLQKAYDFDHARLVMQEMIDLLVLDLVEKRLATDQIVLTVGYDIENLTDPMRRASYSGPVTTDAYGRSIPKHAHGSINLKTFTSSTMQISKAALELFDQIVNPNLLIRRLNVIANHVNDEQTAKDKTMEQLDFFTDYTKKEREEEVLQKERKLQQATLAIKQKFGKNAILKGMSLQEGATARDRNNQIGGHRAGGDQKRK